MDGFHEFALLVQAQGKAVLWRFCLVTGFKYFTRAFGKVFKQGKAHSFNVEGSICRVSSEWRALQKFSTGKALINGVETPESPFIAVVFKAIKNALPTWFIFSSLVSGCVVGKRSKSAKNTIFVATQSAATLLSLHKPDGIKKSV